MSIPADKNVSAKGDEKLTKYQDLRIELDRNVQEWLFVCGLHTK